MDAPGGTPSIADALAVAAYATWQHNGHDIPSALLHVHRNHCSDEIRAMAGEAYDMLLERRWLFEVFENRFAQMLEEERLAQQ